MSQGYLKDIHALPTLRVLLVRRLRTQFHTQTRPNVYEQLEATALHIIIVRSTVAASRLGGDAFDSLLSFLRGDKVYYLGAA